MLADLDRAGLVRRISIMSVSAAQQITDWLEKLGLGRIRAVLCRE